MVRTILISQFPLPYASIGSWTTLYDNYLKTHSGIDCIVCEKPEMHYSGINYSYVKQSFFSRIQTKFLRKNKVEYLTAIDKLVDIDGKYIFQIVDNYGMVKPLNDFLTAKGIRTNSYIQFFYHGFGPYDQFDSSAKFYTLVDEIVVLTNSSYETFKSEIVDLPSYVSILNNGIDTTKFIAISQNEKSVLKSDLEIRVDKVFLWCSQDRPKKGLHIILEAWSRIYSADKNIILIVIGCDARESAEGVKYLGRIPNDELPKYYQVADCFLFPTLCEEGFGMSLIEAKSCGCYCIASNLGGVPEVLYSGRYGKLIKDPHVVKNWVFAIEEFLEDNYENVPFPDNLYSKEKWNTGMDEIIKKAKFRLNNY